MEQMALAIEQNAKTIADLVEELRLYKETKKNSHNDSENQTSKGNNHSKTLSEVEKRFAIRNKINEYKKKVCIRNLTLETADQRSSFFRLLGNRKSSPHKAFAFSEGMRPDIEITRNRAIIMTFPSQQAANQFIKSFIYTLQALDSEDPLETLTKKVNGKNGKPVRIVSVEPGIPKALEGNYYHLKLLARKMKKAGIISKYKIILGNSGPEISVLGHDIRETSEERQRWFTVRKQYPSIRDFSFLDLSKTSEDWEMEEGSPEIYTEKTKVIKETKNSEPENTSGPKSKKDKEKSIHLLKSVSQGKSLKSK